MRLTACSICKNRSDPLCGPHTWDTIRRTDAVQTVGLSGVPQPIRNGGENAMRKFLAILLCAALGVSAAVLAAAAEAGEYIAGGVVTFGSYEQDNNLDNGKEPVEWIVLQTDVDRAFLISRYCLDAHPYNTDFMPMTWEKCTLRVWLNEPFLSDLFSPEEQARILPTAVVNEDNPYYGTYGGKDTVDSIYLLSVGEAYQFFPEEASRAALPTAYAAARGAYVNEATGNTWWWLRTAGVRRIDASGVRQDGRISGYGSRDVYRPSGAIRPVLWVQIPDSN